MPAALDGLKPFNIFSKFTPLCLISSYQDATLDSVKAFGEGGSLDTKFCGRLEKKSLEMEQLFVLLKAMSFLSFKKMFDTHAALNGRLIDFKIFQSSLGLFIFCLKLI